MKPGRICVFAISVTRVDANTYTSRAKREKVETDHGFVVSTPTLIQYDENKIIRDIF